MTAKGYMVSFGGDGNVFKLTVVVAQLYEYIKSHRTVHVKWVNYQTCKLYLNKSVNKENP